MASDGRAAGLDAAVAEAAGHRGAVECKVAADGGDGWPLEEAPAIQAVAMAFVVAEAAFQDGDGAAAVGHAA